MGQRRPRSRHRRLRRRKHPPLVASYGPQAPPVSRLLITADCACPERSRRGGSNGARLRLWKVELQKLANQTGPTICVAHHPPGTSKWNRIEPCMYSCLTRNWRGKPLLTCNVIVQLVAATTTSRGLTLACAIDAGQYPKGRKVSKAQFDALNIRYDDFHPDWNYSILTIRTA
jgi:hypothetical protein